MFHVKPFSIYVSRETVFRMMVPRETLICPDVSRETVGKVIKAASFPAFRLFWDIGCLLPDHGEHGSEHAKDPFRGSVE